MDVYGNDLFECIGDGAILGELVNVLFPDTIKVSDLKRTTTRTGSDLSREDKIENVTIVIQAAAGIGYDLNRAEPVSIVDGR